MAQWIKSQSGFNEGEMSGPNTQEAAFSSAWISRAQRNTTTGTTHVWFHDGYRWTGRMSEDMWNDFVTSSSQGKWWHRQKGNSAFWSS